MAESDVQQYQVRDPQGNIYGPADVATLRAWVADGRIIAGMHLAPADTQDWVEASQHPAVADLLAGGAMVPTPAGADIPTVTTAPFPASPAPVDVPAPYTATFAAPVLKNSQAQWAMICGIVAPVGACLCAPLGLIVGIAAIILGVQGLKKTKIDPAMPGRGQAIAGIVLGAGTLVLAVVAIIIFVVVQLMQPRP